MTQQNQAGINTVTPLVASKGGTGQNSLTQHGVLIGQNTSAVVSKVLGQNEILVGVTSSDPVNIDFTKMQAPFNFMMMGG